jgi:hypothetical protein
MTAATQSKLNVTVTYVAAERPYHEDATPQETVGQLKRHALAAFGLTEGQLPDGSTVTYTLFHGKTRLDNLSQTLGEVAGHAHALSLKLDQQVVQGQAR